MLRSVSYVANANTSCRPTYLTNTKAANEFDPLWSPDSEKITFTSDRGGDRDIHVMNVDGTGQSNLTKNAAQDGPVLRWD